MQVQPRNVSTNKRVDFIKTKRRPIKHHLTKPTTDRHIEQRPETRIMPEHTIRPKVTETVQIPIYPDPLMKSPSQTARCKNTR